MKELIKKTINALLAPMDLEVRRIEALRVAPKNYLRLIEEISGCYRQLGFAELPHSELRMELLARLTGTEISEALHILEYLHQSMDVEGDLCEFGVGAGDTSALLANEISATEKSLWLFDSFQGLPKPGEKDVLLDDIHGVGSIENYQGRMAFPVEGLRARLKRTPIDLARVKIVPGFIEETIGGTMLPEKVAFAYVDFDFYEPILITLDYLQEHMPSGGHIIVDDYGCFSEGAKTAADEFTERHGDEYERILPPDFAGHFIVLKKM